MKYNKLKRSEARQMQEDLNTLATMLGEEQASVLRAIASAYLVEPEYRSLLGKAVKTADAETADPVVEAVPLAVPTATPSTIAPFVHVKKPKTPKVIENDTPEKRAMRLWRAKKASEASIASRKAKKAAEAQVQGNSYKWPKERKTKGA